MSVKMLKPIARGATRIARGVSKNSNWILTILTILGLAGTAISFTDATIKAVKLCEEKQVHGAKEVVKTVWKLYLPGIGCVIVTTLSALGNACINAARLATVTGAYIAGQADIKAIREKTKDMLGERKAQQVEEEVQRDKVLDNPPPEEDQIHKTGHGTSLFRFDWTGTYFRATPEWVDLVFREFNDELYHSYDDRIFMHRLIEKLKLPHAASGDAYWDKVDMLKEGYRQIRADICTCQWMDVNGKQEMVSTLRCDPPPTGFY